MTQQRRPILTGKILILCLLVAFSFVQFAAANPADQPEITPLEAINYFKARHFTGYSSVAIGFLNPEAQLPATVELAIPTGAEIIWFSEVSGGPVANDPEFTEPFNVRTESGLDIYTVTLEHYHSVQIEYRTNYNDNPVTQLSSGTYSIFMQYTPAADLPILRLMTNLPAETTVQDPNVEFMGEDETGDLVFFRIYTDVNAFQTIQGEITYFPPAGLGMPAASGSVWEGLIIALAAGTTVTAIATTFIIITKKRKTQIEEE